MKQFFDKDFWKNTVGCTVGTAYKQPEDGNEGEEGGEALNTLP